MIIAVRLVLESSNSISVFPLITTRPRPVRYASKILMNKENISNQKSHSTTNSEKKKKKEKKNKHYRKI